MTTIQEEYQYLTLVRNILNKDKLSLFGVQSRYNLRNGVIPLLTTKCMSWRFVVEELLWIIRGSTNAKELTYRGVKSLNEVASSNVSVQNNFVQRQEGDLGPVYGFQWRHFGAEYIDMKKDYNKCGIDQLANVISAIRTKPDDRRMLICSWNPNDIPLMVITPYQCLVQFYVSDNELSCQLYQSSGDVGFGVPSIIACYSLLTHMIAHITGLKSGEFIHTIGEAHININHIGALEQQVNRKPRPFPKLIIKRNLKEIDDFCCDDFDVSGYNPYPNIFMKASI